MAAGVFDFRNELCKSKCARHYYVTAPILLGIILLLSSVIIAYKTDFLGAKNETKIIWDIVLLNGPFLPIHSYSIFKMATAGYLFIITGIETFIICKLLEKGIISPKKGTDD